MHKSMPGQLRKFLLMFQSLARLPHEVPQYFSPPLSRRFKLRLLSLVYSREWLQLCCSAPQGAPCMHIDTLVCYLTLWSCSRHLLNNLVYRHRYMCLAGMPNQTETLDREQSESMIESSESTPDIMQIQHAMQCMHSCPDANCQTHSNCMKTICTVLDLAWPGHPSRWSKYNNYVTQ